MKNEKGAEKREKRKRIDNESAVNSRMPEALVSVHDRPSSPSLEQATNNTSKKDADQSQQIKAAQKPVSLDESRGEFTFHPRVSTASTRIVESLGLDFLERQQRHMERQRRLFDDLQNGSLPDDQTPKRPKMNGTKSTGTPTRPSTSDRGLLKKRTKISRNYIRRQTSVLEPIDTNDEGRSLSPSPPSLPPRAKTYLSSVSQSVAASGIYGSVTMRKRSVNDPYANFDRLQKAKLLAEKAIKNKKIFSIHGAYPLIRKALRERGWVEKEFKLPPKLKTTNKSGGDTSDVDDDDDYDDDDDANQKDSGIGNSPRLSFDSNENDENTEPNDCYGIMGRMVRNEVPTFQWTTRTNSIDWRFLQKDQIVNHFSKANFATKVGLCMNLRMVSCFSEGHSDTFFPRCYRLSNEEDKLDFIDDFRITAASSLLKVVISRHLHDGIIGQDKEKFDNGQFPPRGGSHVVPPDVLLFAIRACKTYGEERSHDDIDKDSTILHIPDENWDQLILHYSKLVHEGAAVAQSGSYFKQCEEALDEMKERNPQFFIEGCKNTWIIKPGAKSRGRGIMVMNRLDEILKLVSGDPTLMKDSRWVVQKYIERPLLVYGTKFDVRQWFLVSDWNPVTVWIYRESYLRFSSRSFSLKNLDPSIHLCNYSVQKNCEVEASRHPMLPADNMWSDTDFKDYLKARGCHTLWEDKVFPGMKRAIVHICQTAQDTVEYRKGSFELYGADFMIDENYHPWLIEVNSSPTMSRSTSVTSKLCASVQEDTLKVILDRKKDKNCDIGLFELMYKQAAVDVPLYVGKALNVEGITIKKPVPVVRRSIPIPIPTSVSAPGISSTLSNSKGSPEGNTAAKSCVKAASIYSQNIANRPAKVTIKSNVIASNPSSSKVSSAKTLNKTNSSKSDGTKTPVKIKMQSTLKRLKTEASNTPAKPNAFNLPKYAATAASHSHSTTSVLVQTKPQPRIQTKMNGSLYSVKLPLTDDSANHPSSHSAGHFVSSAQAKAASTMGIVNFGSAYNSVIAAANRGCLPSKVTHPYAMPQAVIPKTFPVSSVAGGEILAGGNTVVHPPPPPGVVALSPQTVGLSLPFQRYYNMNVEQTSFQCAGQPGLQRRNVTYGIQDPRLGGAHPRISGRLY